ncbi:MAG: AAA family ATPase [Deltaproteobacteria bacterium]|nr:AAA family ATPase [Deltaproteobacteria bacterium]
MTFDEILAQTIELLQREGRVSYRALKRRFSLDDEYLDDLKIEIIRAKRLAIDEGGEVLVWTGVQRPPESGSEPRADAPTESRVAAHPTISQEGERRQLTVIFCDLVGSTPLSEQLDPEELRELIRGYQHACIAVITRFDGHIGKYLGDGLLAYFGYPRAHEDDAQRAVRAAMGIVAAMPTLNAEQGRLPVSLKVRLGIHTGLVVVGEMGGGAFREQAAIVGDTPNTAERLQKQAEPDSVVISAATYQLVRGLFDCELLGALSLKGLSAPVQAYRVLRETSAQSRFEVAMQAGLMPLVGRENESAILNERWDRAQSGEGQIVLLSGEPGIGKSRLVQAFREQIRGAPHRWLESHCSPYHQNSALHPIIELLQRTLAFQSDDEPLTKLARLERGLEEYGLSLTDCVPLLAPLFSLPVPEKYPRLTLTLEAQKERTQIAVQSWLLSIAEREGLVMVFEDLHWADPSTLELLGHLLDEVATARLLAVLTYRPEFTPPWSGRSHFATITLGRLLRPQSEGMVKNVTGGKALPPQVLDQIIAKTDGVPLFVEELTRVVLESNLVREQDGHYELAGPLPPLAIPSTLQDSLSARLDRLGRAREVAQLAATIGRDFPYELLRAISPTGDSALQKALAILVEAEVLYRRGLTTQARYFFKHALIRDAAYESLLKSKRQQVHSRIAQVLEEDFRDTAEAQPELVAHHYTQAGLPLRAVPYWRRAGERALKLSANLEAVNHLNNGLRLLDTLGASVDEIAIRQQQHSALLYLLGTAQKRSGNPLESHETLLQAANEAQKIGSSELLIDALQQLTINAYEVGLPMASAVPLMREVLLTLPADDGLTRAKCLNVLARALSMTSSTQEALSYAREGLAIARQLADPESIVRNLGGMAYALQSLDHVMERLEITAEMLKLSKHITDRDLLHDIYSFRTWTLFEAGDREEAEAAIERHRCLAEESRSPFDIALNTVYRAAWAFMQGHFAEAERFAEQAFAIGRQLHAERATGILGLQMFSLRREQGRLRELEPLVKFFLAQHKEAGAWRPGLAVIYAELGRREEAQDQFKHLARFDFADIPRDSMWMVTMTYLADVCTFLHDEARAATLYEMLLPYEHLNVVIGGSTVCCGAVSRHSAALAATLERWDDAQSHFDHALTRNTNLGARPFLAHTQHHYAVMLLARDRPGDSTKAKTLLKEALATARELAMRALAERITSGSP